MASIYDPEPGEPISVYAQRMNDHVRLINGIVQSHAGMLHDFDDVIVDLDWIIALPDDRREEVFALQRRIDRVVSRMNSISRLDRVLYFAEEMAR